MDKVIKLIISYDGTNFYGWQRQSQQRNVQGEIEKVLSKLFNKPIEIHGAGRTDAGVHAYGQVATFSAELPMSLEQLVKVMNNFLPVDIAILKADYMPDEFHARYSAKGKTYEYRILNDDLKDVFKGRHAYLFPYALNEEKMRMACERLTGYHNFESFKASGSSAQNPYRTIYAIELEKSGKEWVLTFTGDGFLYKMVRILVAFLLEIGQERIPLEVIDVLFQQPSRQYTSKVAPAKGLHLKEVFYS